MTEALVALKELLALAKVAREQTPAEDPVPDKAISTAADLIGELLVHGRAVPLSQAQQLVGTGLVKELESDGVLRAAGDLLEPRLRATEWADLILLHDPDEPHRLRHDSVIGINSSTRTLAAITVRRPFEHTLDLGTGCGAQALLAARHSEQVIATDLNPRATHLARQNAALNGIANIELRTGDLFDPVARETFDLIVANLPFVVSPDSTFLFRDATNETGGIAARTVADTHRHLRPGGIGLFLCSWTVAEREHWSEPVREWVKDSGCDALLLYYSTDSPERYTRKWNEAILHHQPNEYLETLGRWSTYFEEERVAGICSGALILRRTEGPPQFGVERMTFPPRGEGGVQIERILRFMEFERQEASRMPLLERVLTPVEGHRVGQVLAYSEGEYREGRARLQLENTAGVDAWVDPTTIKVLSELDGKRSLAEACGRVAQSTEQSQTRVSATATNDVELLLRRGLLTLVR